jgi:hypothetical protein
MINYIIKSDNEKLQIAGRAAALFFKQLELDALPVNFNFTEDTYLEVYANIIDATLCLPDRYIVVKTYRPKWRFTKAIAYAKDETIFINEFKINSLEVADYVGTFVHELAHLIKYKHKGNYVNQFNLGTVPYVLGGLAEAWYRAITLEPVQMDFELNTDLRRFHVMDIEGVYND